MSTSKSLRVHWLEDNAEHERRPREPTISSLPSAYGYLDQRASTFTNAGTTSDFTAFPSDAIDHQTSEFQRGRSRERNLTVPSSAIRSASKPRRRRPTVRIDPPEILDIAGGDRHDESTSRARSPEGMLQEPDPNDKVPTAVITRLEDSPSPSLSAIEANGNYSGQSDVHRTTSTRSQSGYARLRDTFDLLDRRSRSIYGFSSLFEDLPFPIILRLCRLLGHSDFLALRATCQSWYLTLSQIRPLQYPAVYHLPLEVVQQIYDELAPVDFDAARHTCRAWMLGSLNRRLLERMLRRSGWWSKAELELERQRASHPDARHQSSESWLLSCILATECSLIRHPISSETKSVPAAAMQLDGIDDRDLDERFCCPVMQNTSQVDFSRLLEAMALRRLPVLSLHLVQIMSKQILILGSLLRSVGSVTPRRDAPIHGNGPLPTHRPFHTGVDGASDPNPLETSLATRPRPRRSSHSSNSTIGEAQRPSLPIAAYSDPTGQIARRHWSVGSYMSELLAEASGDDDGRTSTRLSKRSTSHPEMATEPRCEPVMQRSPSATALEAREGSHPLTYNLTGRPRAATTLSARAPGVFRGDISNAKVQRSSSTATAPSNVEPESQSPAMLQDNSTSPSLLSLEKPPLPSSLRNVSSSSSAASSTVSLVAHRSQRSTSSPDPHLTSGDLGRLLQLRRRKDPESPAPSSVQRHGSRARHRPGLYMPTIWAQQGGSATADAASPRHSPRWNGYNRRHSARTSVDMSPDDGEDEGEVSSDWDATPPLRVQQRADFELDADWQRQGGATGRLSRRRSSRERTRAAREAELTPGTAIRGGQGFPGTTALKRADHSGLAEHSGPAGYGDPVETEMIESHGHLGSAWCGSRRASGGANMAMQAV